MTKEHRGTLTVFATYVTSNILGMIGLSCYILADTFFIARGCGAAGLTALNLALPAYSLMHGLGLMVGIAFDDGIKAADVRAACEKAGLLVLTAKTRLRLLPPLILTADDVDDALATLRSVLEKCV